MGEKEQFSEGGDLRFAEGDVLLVMGLADDMQHFARSDSLLQLEGMRELPRRSKAVLAAGIMGGSITLASMLGFLRWLSGLDPSVVQMHNVFGILASSLGMTALACGALSSFCRPAPGALYLAPCYLASCVVAGLAIYEGEELDKALQSNTMNRKLQC